MTAADHNTVWDTHLITREIGIDMGHRVSLHGSKCRNLHGHRYTVHAICRGLLATEGEQDGMVLDFGFLKELMMEHIDGPCDHGTCLWINDPELAHALGPVYRDIKSFVLRQGQWEGLWGWGKLYVVPFTPTAENLARHWCNRLSKPVAERSDNRALLHSVKVFETPNCSAEYINRWISSA